MKKFIYQACSIGIVLMAIGQFTIAQASAPPPPPAPPVGKGTLTINKGDQTEIVIRQKGEKNSKITLEIKNGEYFINGKPLEKFDDQNFEVEKREIDENVIVNPDAVGRGYGPDMVISPFRERQWDQVARGYADQDMARKIQKVIQIRMNAAYLGVSSRKAEKGGATVLEVTKGSPAEKAGIKKGDIISKVNDTKIESPDGLYETIHDFKPGEKIKVTFKRDGKEQTVTATLEKSDPKKDFNYNYDYNYKFKMPPMPDMEGMDDFWNPKQYKLGIKVQDAEDGKGVNVLEVEDSSAASKAGIRKGDIILQFDGGDVNDTNELIGQTEAARQKSVVRVKILRNGINQEIELKIPRKLKSAEL